MMEQKENQKRHMIDTLLHKQYMLGSCILLIEKLCADNRFDDALALARRAGVHDDSKLWDDEIEYFIQVSSTGKTSTPNGILTNDQRRLIEAHWKRNRHHPEFFSDYHEMTEIDIMEMVCDWHARSKQFGNTLRDFVETVVKDRFGFDEDFYNKVLEYVKMLENQ